MFVPSGMTEEQVLREIKQIVDKISPTYTFGYYDLEDIKQEATIEALSVLPSYDTTRPLANFLFVHIKRRLLNLRRNKYKRTDAPCSLCHNHRHHEHENGKMCKKYVNWKKNNSTKANLTHPLTIHHINEDTESNVEIADTISKEIANNELRELINTKLDPSLRNDYLRMLAREKIPKVRRKKVEVAIREIVASDYLDE